MRIQVPTIEPFVVFADAAVDAKPIDVGRIVGGAVHSSQTKLLAT